MPAGSYMRHIQDQGHLTVGVSQSTYLFGFLNPGTGNIEGFDVDILKQVAKAIFGDKPDAIQYKAVTSAQRIPYVKDGTVDIVAATMTINCARWQQVDFSTEYYHAGQKALVPQTSAATTTDALKGHKVCAAAGSTSIDNITTKLSAVPVSVSDWTDCLVALQHGQVDAISTDDTILAGLKAQDPYTRIVAGPNGEAFTNEPYGMAISQDHPEFVSFVNGVLDQIRANGTWANIYNAWVGRLFPGVATPPPPTAVYTR
jgi:polar amino acid transport system substrate-binding protein